MKLIRSKSQDNALLGQYRQKMFFFLNIFTTCSFRNFAHFQFLPIWFCHILNIFWNLKSILKWFSSLYAFLGDMFSWVIHLQRVNPQNSHFSCILCLTFGTSVGWHNCLGKNKTMQDNICSLVTRFFSTHTPQLLPFFLVSFWVKMWTRELSYWNLLEAETLRYI